MRILNYPAKKKHYSTLLLLIILFLIPCAARAEIGQVIHVIMHGIEDNTASFGIDSNYSHGSATVFSAGYSGNKMTSLSQMDTTVSAGRQEVSQTLSDEFTTAKVFLFDAETFEPLSKPGQQISATFLDYNGDILSQQNLWSGHSVGYPGIPTRDGYCFYGWDKPLSAIYEDTSYTATYIANTEKNIFTVSSVQGEKGKEVTVSVYLTGSVNLCGFNMALFYNSDALEFKSLDSEWAMDVIANHVASESKVYFNYSARNNRNTGGKVLEITYVVRDSATGNTILELLPETVICIDDNDASRIVHTDYSLTKGVVYIQ